MFDNRGSPDFLGTPDGIADPYPAFRALRETSPVRYLRLPASPLTGVKEPLYAWVRISAIVITKIASS